jgi:ABC-type multidrug transport system ATPase subunit
MSRHDVALEMTGVVKRFRDVQALDGVDLTVRRGEAAVVLGANGAGKSTLLRIVAGSIRPDQGHVSVAGVDAVRRDVDARRRVGWALGDEHSWYWRLTGRQNLEVFGGLRGLPPRDVARHAADLLAELQLADAADRPVAAYSTGMKARLGLARARLGDPALMVLDEPSRGLDAGAEERYVEWLRGRGDAAILMVTHTLPEAVSVADRVVVLRRGRVHHELTSDITLARLERIVREAE